MRPFAYLFNTYWSELQPVAVATDALPRFRLPPNFLPRSVSDNGPLPASQWSDGLIRALEGLASSHVVLLLEDYWLTRTVDHHGVATLTEWAENHPDVLRVDLTDDRQYNGRMEDIGTWGHYDLVETPGDSEYQMSLQAGIWNREALLSVLHPGMSPWDVELHTGPRLHGRKNLRVVGTRQSPMRYVNAFKSGKGHQLQNLGRIPKDHLKHIRSKGWLSQTSSS